MRRIMAEKARPVIDGLTGFKNGWANLESVAADLRARSDGNNVSVIYADMDDFRRMNDVHGLYNSDRILRAVTRILQSVFSAPSEIYRIRGDDFLITLKDFERTETLRHAEEVRRKVEALQVGDLEDFAALQNGRIELPTITLGVVSSDGAAWDFLVLLERAKSAHQNGKRYGKNQVSY